jgi:hypothetical protein
VYRLLDELSPESLGAEQAEGEIPGLRFTPDAQELFNEFRGGLEKRIRGGDGSAPAFESHMSKYRSLMPSLALIFHLVNVVGEQEQGAVGLQSTRLAANWCDYLEHHARKLYATELYPDLTTAHLIATKIRAGAITDEMHIRDIYRPQWSGLTVPEVVWNGFRVLEGCNMVRIDRKDTLGRPADVIQLHPSLKGAAA